MKNVEYDFRTIYFQRHAFGSQFYSMIRTTGNASQTYKSMLYTKDKHLDELLSMVEMPIHIKNYFKAIVEI